MAEQVIFAKSCVEGDPTGEDRPVEMKFTIRVNPDGNLGPLTAIDPQGNEHLVSLKINTPDGPMCCCPDGNGDIRCVPIKLGCNCDPK